MLSLTAYIVIYPRDRLDLRDRRVHHAPLQAPLPRLRHADRNDGVLLPSLRLPDVVSPAIKGWGSGSPPDDPSGRPADAARMLSMTTYMLVLFGIISICGIAALVTPRYKRLCPGCDMQIATTVSYCRHCGYQMV